MSFKSIQKIIANVFVYVFKYASFDETGVGGVFIENAILYRNRPTNTPVTHFTRLKTNILIVCGISAFSLMTIQAIADTTVCFEAEDARELKAPVKIVEVTDKVEAASVSGGKIIEIEQGAGEGSKVGGYAKYKISLKEDGTYYFWARCWWLDSCGNSFGIKIGDKPEFIMGNDGTYKSWHWLKSKLSLKLEKGVYDLEIVNREDGIKIDQILITSDRKLVPVEIEKSEKLPE